jgi:HD-like signal output (HDOD) protein
MFPTGRGRAAPLKAAYNDMTNEATAVPENEVKQVVNNIGIPACPAVLTKLVREMRGDDPDFRKITGLIGADVGLAAAMLKTVNSPFYGLRTKASSVSQALALLGIRNVDRLVTGLLLRETFAGAASKTMEAFWESSSSIAQLTAWLAPKLKVVNNEDAYTFSLFRDCGVAALLSTFNEFKPPRYGITAMSAEEMLQGERGQFGMDHAALGARMAKTWMLPETTCDAVLHHHNYDGLMSREIEISDVSVKLISLAMASEWIYTMHVAGKPCMGWDRMGEFALEKLGLEDADLESYVEEAETLISE